MVIIDFRRHTSVPISLHIKLGGVPSFKFLAIHIAEDLSRSTNTSNLVKKVCDHFLRRTNNREERLFESLYRGTIKSMLVYSISVWYVSTTANDKKKLQRVINITEKIAGCHMPSLGDITTFWCLITKTTKDLTRRPTPCTPSNYTVAFWQKIQNH